MMLQNQIHHLIVVDAQGHLIGILSTMDILEAFARPALEKKPD
jgi:CBS-domain-containing membrane protein